MTFGGPISVVESRVSPDGDVAAANSPEAQAFSEASVHAWTAVVESSGSATSDDIAAATEVSLAQFAPDTGN